MTRAHFRGDDDEVLVARAIADPTRLTLLRHIDAADGPVGVRALAETFRLHPNAVRQHLAHLRDAGLIVEETHHTGEAGRPPLSYRPNPQRRGDLADWNPYQTLSQVLVDVVAGRPARDVGADYGRRIAQDSPEESAIDALTALARRHGFQPTVDARGDEIDLVLGRCAFAASVIGDRVVCEVHLGIAEGIAEARGGAHIAALDITPQHAGGCRFHVRLTDGGPPT